MPCWTCIHSNNTAAGLASISELCIPAAVLLMAVKAACQHARRTVDCNMRAPSCRQACTPFTIPGFTCRLHGQHCIRCEGDELLEQLLPSVSWVQLSLHQFCLHVAVLCGSQPCTSFVKSAHLHHISCNLLQSCSCMFADPRQRSELVSELHTSLLRPAGCSWSMDLPCPPLLCPTERAHGRAGFPVRLWALN